MAIKNFEDFINERASRKYNPGDALFEMASVGYFGGKDSNNFFVPHKLKVFVNESECPIPHFHIWDDDTNGKQFHTRLQILKPEYMREGNHISDTLTQNEILVLMRFLSQNNVEFLDKTNWEIIVSMWNLNNPQHTLNATAVVMPDYMRLK